jgi:hypothetical protein
MLLTESGMVTDDRLVHRWNAAVPMLVTELGMLTWPKASGSIVHRAEAHEMRASRTTMDSDLGHFP